jgi:hypothetical protein
MATDVVDIRMKSNRDRVNDFEANAFRRWDLRFITKGRATLFSLRSPT